jgi:hypothetical protein
VLTFEIRNLKSNLWKGQMTMAKMTKTEQRRWDEHLMQKHGETPQQLKQWRKKVARLLKATDHK